MHLKSGRDNLVLMLLIILVGILFLGGCASKNVDSSCECPSEKDKWYDSIDKDRDNDGWNDDIDLDDDNDGWYDDIDRDIDNDGWYDENDNDNDNDGWYDENDPNTG